MLLRFVTIFSLSVSFGTVHNAVLAQESAQSGATEVSEGAENGGNDLFRQQTLALKDKVKGITKSLELQEVNHFFVLYSNYTVYSKVKAVRDDVHNAVKACSENNKDMASGLESKFSGWDGAVSAAMKTSKADIDNMVLAQNYIQQDDVNVVFGLVDEVGAKDSSRFETTPVTTPEACEFMMSKMDETQSSMIKLLKGSMMAYPNLIQKNQK